MPIDSNGNVYDQTWVNVNKAKDVVKKFVHETGGTQPSVIRVPPTVAQVGDWEPCCGGGRPVCSVCGRPSMIWRN